MITLTLTDQQLNLVGEALVQLPYKVVVGLLEEISKQVEAQKKPEE